jgi:hypothetical protein
MNTELSIKYINAKYGNPSAFDLIELRKEAAAEIDAIREEKEDIYRKYPRAHGRFQQSQLDVLDIREQKARAVYQNVCKMM